MARLTAGVKQHFKDLEHDRLVEEPKRQAEKAKIDAERNRGYARKRKDLGFKDDAEEVDDKVLEKLEFDDRVYQKALTESRARPRIKLATQIRGVGKDEIY